MDNIDNKYHFLQNQLIEMESVLVAFSGGVDSTFLLKTAKDALAEKVIAVTARSSTYPSTEFVEAKKLAKIIGTEHIEIISEELDIPEFKQNPVNRCYYCKGELFSKLKTVAASRGLKYVVDGTNYDDINDHRPGMQAACELGVISPLKEAKLQKDEIRILSKRVGLPTWDKSSFACLASRFPYGDTITPEKLDMVDKAEAYLKKIGFKQVRVRHHGTIARIEIEKKDQNKIFEEGMQSNIIDTLKNIGFNYITIDLEGYRTGSMNEVIPSGSIYPEGNRQP